MPKHIELFCKITVKSDDIVNRSSLVHAFLFYVSIFDILFHAKFVDWLAQKKAYVFHINIIKNEKHNPSGIAILLYFNESK